MDNAISNILGETGLPSELVASLQEAFDRQVADAREDAEVAIREEFARRYESDKAQLVEAMDRLLTDALREQAEANQAQIKKFVEARAEARKAVKEAKTRYETKLREHVEVSQRFIMENLAKHVGALKEQKKNTIREAARISRSFEATKKALAEAHAARLAKADAFIKASVERELKEFQIDKRALVETRVKLIKESRSKMADLKKRFVAESAKKVEKLIAESLKSEMKQLHEDLERNRQNLFGRRIFEAVAAEFMTSYLAEGTEVRKLQNILESKNTELKAVQSKLDEVAKNAEAAQRKAKLAETAAQRTKIMSELMSNLRGDKRSIMESMLETTKTENLRTAFEKYLPVVLNETARKNPAPQGKKTLSENSGVKSVAKAVSGDRANRLFESTQAEAEVEAPFDNEIAHVVRLAGINKF